MGYLLFLLLNCMVFIYFLDIIPLSDTRFANVFSYSVGCLFVLLIASFAVQKLFSLMYYCLLLLPALLVPYLSNLCQGQYQGAFLLFSSRSFMVVNLFGPPKAYESSGLGVKLEL